MKINSIKSKILTVVLLSTFISFVILGFYNTKSSYTSEYNMVKQEELSIAIDTSNFINSYIQSKIDILEAIVDELQDVTVTADNDIVIDKLRLSTKAGKFVDVYIGFENDGSLVLSNKDILNIEKDNYDARKRPWYQDAVKTRKSGVSNPYVDVSTKKLVVSVYTPLLQDGKLIGVVGSDIFIDTIVDTILNIKIPGMGLAYLVNDENNVIIHKNKELLNKPDTLLPQVLTKNKADFNEAIRDDVDKLAAYSTIATTNWKLVVEVEKDSIYEEINNNVLKEIILYIVLLLIIVAFIFFSLLKVLAPIKKVESGLQFFFRYLKGEESNISKLDIKTNDEFGNMASMIDQEMVSVASSLEKDKELIEEVKQVVNHINHGKLNIKVNKSTTNKSLDELKDILNSMIKTIQENVNDDINPIVQQLKEYSNFNFVDTIDNANGNVAKGLNDLCNIINKMLQENKANGLELQQSSDVLLNNVDTLNRSSNTTAVSLEETAASIEEITSTVVSNTNRIAEMTEHSNELSNSISEGQNLATSTVKSMDEINEQTQSIAEAITVIDQIAFQTNILSLNAAVEAATAGEAGKGFAVVAQEVRNLATRSAEAAREIKTLVENATSKTNNGKQIADHMIAGYEKLNENIEKTTRAIKDISDASKEQKTSIEQINDVINKLDQQTQNNASVAAQTHDIAKNTSDLANKILDNVHKKKFRE